MNSWGRGDVGLIVSYKGLKVDKHRDYIPEKYVHLKSYAGVGVNSLLVLMFSCLHILFNPFTAMEPGYIGCSKHITHALALDRSGSICTDS